MLARFPLTPLGVALLVALLILGANLAPALAAIEFKHALDDSPLDVKPPPDEAVTDAVKQFHESGSNPYDRNTDAIAEGKEAFNVNCQVCHGKLGEGRMCPSLIDEQFAYPRVAMDIGMFEVIYGGASGAMRSFKGRLTQDQILKVIAYVNSLKPH